MAPNVGLNLAINAVKNGMKREDAAKLYNVELQELNNAIMRELLPNLETEAQQQTENTVKIDKSKLKQLMANIKKHPDGANVISSKCDRIIKKEDGSMEFHPAEGESESIKVFNFDALKIDLRKFIKPINFDHIDREEQVRQEKAFNKAFGSFMEKLTDEQKKEFKENPVDFLRNHPELQPKIGINTDNTEQNKYEEQ